MYENVIKGGIKPGMVIATDDATKLHTCELWIVFPDKNKNLCAVKYGSAAWTSLKQEADKLYVGRYQCTNIYEPPTTSIGSYGSLIWNDEKGIVNPEYKVETIAERIKKIENLFSSEADSANTQEPTYFY